MRKNVSWCVIILVSILLFDSVYVKAGTWIDFNDTGSQIMTQLYGVDGGNLVGSYRLDGFLYNNITKAMTILTSPWCGKWGQTYARGISGNNIVGYDSQNNSFLYNTATQNWSGISYPGGNGTWATGIDGSRIVGHYGDPLGKGVRGFIYDMTNNTWTSLDAPGSAITAGGGTYTYAEDIEGDIIVGHHIASSGDGFLYNINNSSWATFDMPGKYQTNFRSINGNNIVGDYSDNNGYSHGFLYNGTNWTTIDYPGARYTYLSGISGNTIVGYRSDAYGSGLYAVIYTIPEPATLLLLGLGAAIAIRKQTRS